MPSLPTNTNVFLLQTLNPQPNPAHLDLTNTFSLFSQYLYPDLPQKTQTIFLGKLCQFNNNIVWTIFYVPLIFIANAPPPHIHTHRMSNLMLCLTCKLYFLFLPPVLVWISCSDPWNCHPSTLLIQPTIHFLPKKIFKEHKQESFMHLLSLKMQFHITCFVYILSCFYQAARSMHACADVCMLLISYTNYHRTLLSPINIKNQKFFAS